MPFKFGPKSLKELEGVHPKLVGFAHRTLHYSPIDIGVHDGLRTEEEQREYLRTGVSTTMNSKHLRQSDGFSHAIDLVPFVNWKLRWEWPLIFQIVSAAHRAAVEERVGLIWGGAWDLRFPSDYGNGSAQLIQQRVDGYVARRKKQGKRAFIDGPHFELAL